MSMRHFAIVAACLALLLACGQMAWGGQVSAASTGSAAPAARYALYPADGWHVAGTVAVQAAPNGDHLLSIAVTGPDAEVTQRFVWHVAALSCDDWGSPARYLNMPKLYFPGTMIERSRVFSLTEDRFTDSGRRTLGITVAPDWTSQQFSVAAFAFPTGRGTLVTCADLPPLP